MKAIQAGIWMDHNQAYLIEFSAAPMEAIRIDSPMGTSRKPNLRFGEKRMHATETRKQSAYYKELSERIMRYKEVILFGPGTARKELFNLLYENHVFQQVDVSTAHTDKLTPRQMNAFVRKHFDKSKTMSQFEPASRL